MTLFIKGKCWRGCLGSPGVDPDWDDGPLPQVVNGVIKMEPWEPSGCGPSDFSDCNGRVAAFAAQESQSRRSGKNTANPKRKRHRPAETPSVDTIKAVIARLPPSLVSCGLLVDMERTGRVTFTNTANNRWIKIIPPVVSADIDMAVQVLLSPPDFPG